MTLPLLSNAFYDDRVLLGAISTRLGLFTNFFSRLTNKFASGFIQGGNKSISGGGCCPPISGFPTFVGYCADDVNATSCFSMSVGGTKIATAFFVVVFIRYRVVSSCGVRARRTPPQSFAGSKGASPTKFPPPHSRVMQQQQHREKTGPDSQSPIIFNPPFCFIFVCCVHVTARQQSRKEPRDTSM